MKGTKLTGLWKNKAQKTKKVFLAGNLGAARVLVLQNDFKKAETDPDYVLWVVPRENGRKKEEQEGDQEDNGEDL